MQQPVGEGIGEIFDDLVGGFARSEHAPGLLHGLQTDGIGVLPQRADGGSRVMRAQSGQKARHLLFEQQPGVAGRHFALLAIFIDQLLQIVDRE